MKKGKQEKETTRSEQQREQEVGRYRKTGNWVVKNGRQNERRHQRQVPNRAEECRQVSGGEGKEKKRVRKRQVTDKRRAGEQIWRQVKGERETQIERQPKTSNKER